MAAQKADLIVVDGVQMELYSNPLEEFWTRRHKKHPSFYEVDVCRRGYIATWEIRENQLFLIDIDGIVEKQSFFGRKSVKCTLKMLFPKSGKAGIKADWFSGKLRIPRGKMTQYEHSGYDSRFEKELILTIENGNLLKMATLDYTQRRLVVNTAPAITQG